MKQRGLWAFKIDYKSWIEFLTMFTRRGRILLLCAFLLVSFKVASFMQQQQQMRRVCYFTNWSCDLLVKESYFCLRDLDMTLCSHVIYAFAGIDLTSLSLSPTRVDDESDGEVKGRYVQFNDMKKNHSSVKTLLSAGGNYQAEKFKNATRTGHSRRLFAYNIASYVRRWGFDGLDLDWEYPSELEKEALTQLVQELRSTFRNEAQQTGKEELLLSLAAPVGEERILLGYQVDRLSKDLDMINLMAYDFYYGAWGMTAFNSPLYPRRHHNFSNKHSVEWIVQLWIRLGAPPHKINLGIAGYGQSFTLQIHNPATTAASRSGTEKHNENVQRPDVNATNSHKYLISQDLSALDNNSVKNNLDYTNQLLVPFSGSALKNTSPCGPDSVACVSRKTQLPIRNNAAVSDTLSEVNLFNETALTSFGNLVKSNLTYNKNNTDTVKADIRNNESTIYGRQDNMFDNTDIYRSQHNIQDHHGNTIYGVDKPDSSGDAILKVVNNKRHGHSDNTIYGVDKPDHSDNALYGVNKPDHNYNALYGVDIGAVIHDTDKNKQRHKDMSLYGVHNSKIDNNTKNEVDNNKQSHDDNNNNKVDGNKQDQKYAAVFGVGSKATGPGMPGRLRHLKGQLSYPEICEMIQAGAATLWDQEQMVPYITLGNQWVGFDDIRSVAEKVRWASQQNLGGVMFWSLDLDDFKGRYCNQGRYPLLSAMSNTVISLFNQEKDNNSEHVSISINSNNDFDSDSIPFIHGLKMAQSTNNFGEGYLQTSKTISDTVFDQTTMHTRDMTTKGPKQNISRSMVTTKEGHADKTAATLPSCIGARNVSHPNSEDGVIKHDLHNIDSKNIRNDTLHDADVKSIPPTLVDSNDDELDVSNFDYHYIAFNANAKPSALPSTATSSTTFTATTTSKTKRGKPNKTSRKRLSKRRHLYRNISWTLVSSINVVIYKISATVTCGFIVLLLL